MSASRHFELAGIFLAIALTSGCGTTAPWDGTRTRSFDGGGATSSGVGSTTGLTHTSSTDGSSSGTSSGSSTGGSSSGTSGASCEPITPSGSSGNSETSPVAACAPAFNGFQLPATPLPFAPTGVVAADVDGDGRTDLVVYDASQIAVLRNAGDGTLHLEQVAIDGGIGAVAAGKLDADRRATVVVAPASAPGVELISALDDGGFGVVSFDDGVTATAVALANLNGNGLQIVARDLQGTVEVLSPDAGYTAVQQVYIAGGSALAALDLDGDGRDDLLVAQGDGGIESVRNLCGVLQPAVPTGLPALGPWATLDFNRDHFADVVGDVNDAFEAFRGEGDGTFAKVGSPISWPDSQQRYVVSPSLVVTHLDAAQTPEVVLSSQLGFAAVLRFNGNDFAVAEQYDLLDATELAAFDLNGDGLPDLVATTSNGKTEARGFLTESQGWVRAARVYWGNTGAFVSLSQDALAVGDYNADGYPDFCTGTICGTAFMSFVNRGGRNFDGSGVPWGQTLLIQTTPPILGPPRFAIVNGDEYPPEIGIFDFADGGSTSTQSIIGTDEIVDNALHQFAFDAFLADGGLGLVFANPSVGAGSPVLFEPVDGGWGNPRALSNSGVAAMASGDFDGDGRIDLVTVGNEIGVVLNGPAGLGSHVIHNPVTASQVAAGDLDGDGRDEIVVPADGLLDLLRLSADAGTLDVFAQVPLDPSFSPSAVTVGDVTGDSVPDVLVSGNYVANGLSNNELMLFPGNGDGGLSAPIRVELYPGPGRAPSDLAIADFDLDGRPDLLVATGIDAERGAQIFFNSACR